MDRLSDGPFKSVVVKLYPQVLYRLMDLSNRGYRLILDDRFWIDKLHNDGYRYLPKFITNYYLFYRTRFPIAGKRLVITDENDNEPPIIVPFPVIDSIRHEGGEVVLTATGKLYLVSSEDRPLQLLIQQRIKSIAGGSGSSIYTLDQKGLVRRTDFIDSFGESIYQSIADNIQEMVSNDGLGIVAITHRGELSTITDKGISHSRTKNAVCFRNDINNCMKHYINDHGDVIELQGGRRIDLPSKAIFYTASCFNAEGESFMIDARGRAFWSTPSDDREEWIAHHLPIISADIDSDVGFNFTDEDGNGYHWEEGEVEMIEPRRREHRRYSELIPYGDDYEEYLSNYRFDYF